MLNQKSMHDKNNRTNSASSKSNKQSIFSMLIPLEIFSEMKNIVNNYQFITDFKLILWLIYLWTKFPCKMSAWNAHCNPHLLCMKFMHIRQCRANNTICIAILYYHIKNKTSHLVQWRSQINDNLTNHYITINFINILSLENCVYETITWILTLQVK